LFCIIYAEFVRISQERSGPSDAITDTEAQAKLNSLFCPCTCEQQKVVAGAEEILRRRQITKSVRNYYEGER